MVTYAGLSDVEEIEHFFGNHLAKNLYYNPLAKENEKKAYSLNKLMLLHGADDRSIIISKDSGVIDGICINRFDDHTIWLSWIIAKNERVGTGTKMLEKLYESATERYCHKVWCDSRTENLVSINFLLKNGFRMICKIDRHWYGEDFYLLEKNL